MPDTTAASKAARSGNGLESKDGCMAIYAPTRHRIVEAILTGVICMYRPGQNAKSKCHFSKIEHGHDVPCLLVNSLEFRRELQLM